MTKASNQPATAPAAALPGRWSRPVPLSGGATGSPGGTHPLLAGGGNVHVVWEAGGRIHYRRSTDAGGTWADAVALTSGGTAVYPCSLELTGSVLHLIWPDKRHAGLWEVYTKRSADGGLTWSAAERLADGQHGQWAPAAVAGTESSAIVLLSRSNVLYASIRPAPGGRSPGQSPGGRD